MTESVAIGIDLGTTFSAAAIYENGQSKIIPNLEGDYLTPSLIFYDPRTLDVFVGTSADDLALSKIENFLYDMKRILGRKYDDAYVQKMIQSGMYKYNIVEGRNGMAEVQIKQGEKNVTKTPEQVCSEIISYLKKSAEKILGKKVTDAVISVPAHFSNAQRKATKAAAQMAQLNVLKLITEPVAAAVHYSFDKTDAQSTMLVFDWGGGTLDVSIINVHNKKFEVKSVEGDTFLGGRDFDKILINHFKKTMENKFGSAVFNDRRLEKRLSDFCKRIKVKLSTSDKYSIPMDYIKGYDDENFELSLTRGKFEERTNSLFTRALNIVELAIKNSDFGKDAINEVVLVGGTSRIPKIQRILIQYFDEKIVKANTNPDEAVALGAALQAALLKDQCQELEEYRVSEVTPLSIGTELNKGLFLVHIKKNTSLPAISEKLITATSCNNDTRSTIQMYVCEGERKNCKFNNRLGTFQIHGIPPGKAGDIKFETYFELDEDGILTVRARETTTGNPGKLVVTIGEYHLCENQIKKALTDAEKNRKEDEAFEKFVTYLYEKQQICNEILYYIDKLPTENQEFAKEKCNSFLEKCDTYEYTEFENFKKAYEEFEHDIKPKVIGFLEVFKYVYSPIDQRLSDLSICFKSVLERRKKLAKKQYRVQNVMEYQKST